MNPHGAILLKNNLAVVKTSDVVSHAHHRNRFRGCWVHG